MRRFWISEGRLIFVLGTKPVIMQRTLSFLSCISLSLILLTACGGSSDKNGKDGKDGKGNEKTYKNMKEMDLSKQGVQATIQVPKKDPDKGIRPAQVSASTRGGAVIQAGKPYQLKVMQVPPRKMSEKKKDIKNMTQLELSFVKDTDSLLIYKESVPGGGKEMFSFYMAKEVNGKPFVFESGEGEFSRKDIDMMIRSANSVKVKERKKAS